MLCLPWDTSIYLELPLGSEYMELAQKANGPFVIEIAIDYSDNLKRRIES